MFPLSTSSEGSQPYAYYKNSAHVSDSSMSKMQPTYVYTLQQEPECSSHCGVDGILRESLAPSQEGHIFQTPVPRLATVLHPLRGPAPQQSCSSFSCQEDNHSQDLWELSPASGKGPKAQVPVGEEMVRKQQRSAQRRSRL